MYLAYKPPQMLPTQTLNPTTSATDSSKATGKAKRGSGYSGLHVEALNKNALLKSKERINADKWWWIGVGVTALGGVGYYCF